MPIVGAKLPVSCVTLGKGHATAGLQGLGELRLPSIRLLRQDEMTFCVVEDNDVALMI